MAPKGQAKKKNKNSGALGKALINNNERRHKKENRGEVIVEETNGPAYNTNSVTAETALDEFLARAHLANTDFTAERGNAHIVSGSTQPRIVSDEERRKTSNLHARYAHELRIPRRPPWTDHTTKEQLLTAENAAFLEWRKKLAEIEEVAGLVLTPFERNLELWRQLWRVLERSQIMVQIVDARNPLLFRSLDLEDYARNGMLHDGNGSRQTLLLLNKADLLTRRQREDWASYLNEQGVRAIFWSAIDETEPTDDENEPEEQVEVRKNQFTSPELFSTDSLLKLLKKMGADLPRSNNESRLVVGMVGYPNVGKSSTINRILGEKKVSVSATPGKTRHFQTLMIDDELCLCDCPGLVMPSFTFGRDEMHLNGILPVAQMRYFIEPVTLAASRFPRHVFENTYGLNLPRRADEDDVNPFNTRPLELLTSLAFVRGYMSHKGVPDSSRAARMLVRDVVEGRLCWVAPPPNCAEPKQFNHYENTGPVLQPSVGADSDTAAPDEIGAEDGGQRKASDGNPMKNQAASDNIPVQLAMMSKRHLLPVSGMESDRIDREFFERPTATGFVLDPRNRKPAASADSTEKGKKHGNRKKKEKLRRIYGHLDI